VLGGEGGRAQNINYKVRRKGTLLAYWTMILGSSTKLLVVKSGTCIHESYPQQQQQQQQHSLFSQASWGRLEMKPERNKFKVQAH